MSTATAMQLQPDDRPQSEEEAAAFKCVDPLSTACEEKTDAIIARLAALPPLEYDRVRKAEAEKLGVRVDTLDSEVRKARGDSAVESGAGCAVMFPELEPWPEAVNGAALLDDLTATFKRFVILPEHADIALALWVLHTYTIEAASASPILASVSPEKRCGKSTLLDLLGRLVSRPLPTSNILPAALFRSVEKWHPTLLIDEADTFLKDNDELRGVLNSGHTRGSAFVIRTVGDDHEPRRFSTWGPKAIAMIGALPDTLADRSITIPMRRKLP